MAQTNAETAKTNAKASVLDTTPCSVTLSIEVPVADVAAETAQVFDGIQKVAQVPGFRQGKAPMDMVKRNYQSAAREKVVENLIQKTAFTCLKEQGFEPIAAPRIEEVNFEFDKAFQYKVKAEKHPEVKAKDYTGIKVKKDVREITDALVKKSLDSLRERNARLEASNADAVTDKHFVLVDYDGALDGQVVPEMKTKDYLIDLTMPHNFKGLKEGLAGMKKGETKDIPVTFPEDYPNPKFKAKDAVLTVNVREIKEKVLPALDDELAKDFGVPTLAELEGKVRETLEGEEKKRQQQDVEKQIIDALVTANAFPVPEALVEEQLRQMLARMVEYYRRQRMPDAVWQKNLPAWQEKYKPEAERSVRLSYILNSIADQEKIAVTDADIAAELDTVKKANAGKETDVEKYFTEQKDAISSRMKEEKLFAFLIEKAKIKESVVKE